MPASAQNCSPGNWSTGPLLDLKPEIGEPDEPEQPEMFALYDLVRLCQSLAWDAERLRSRRNTAPGQ